MNEKISEMQDQLVAKDIQIIDLTNERDAVEELVSNLDYLASFSHCAARLAK